ncbi:MAG: sensor histidine kinase KdpD [Magnetococcales bacterium]|nr:sensor histidine kinase KdpD [Magnetococcales bacterium]
MEPHPASSAPTKERILVCVSPSPASARLIHAACRQANGLGASWMVVTVDAPDAYAMTATDRQRLLAHLRLADSLGAETIRLTGHRVSHEVIRCALQYGVTRILIGKPTLNRWRDRFKPSLIHDLVRNSGAIEVQCLAGEDLPQPAIAPRSAFSATHWSGYAASLLAVALTTLMAYLGRGLLTSPDLVMLYLLPVMAMAFRFGQGPSLVASLFSVGAYNFFFVPPYFTFAVSDPQAALTFTILFAVGMVVSGLMTHIRRQEREARERERQTDALHALNREVMTTLDEREMAGIITRHAARLFGGPVAVCLHDEHGQLSVVSATPEHWQPTVEEWAMMRWSCDHGLASGRGTINLADNQTTALPLLTSHAFGVLILRIVDPEFLNADHRFFLEAFTHQATLAIDRARLSEKARSAAIRVKSEELRGTLLNMASHDLRTPLASIIGAGTALRDDSGNLDPGQQRELQETICTEAERMERLIFNLLEMVRLESGGCHLRREWIPFEEIAGSVLVRMEKRFHGRRVHVTVDEKVQMLYVDPVFIEQVLINLLDNAIKYTPPRTPIHWSVESRGDRVAIRVRDEGAGIPAGEEERIFEKFTRGPTTAIPGSGLGLAICRGVIQAHGGTIQVVPNKQGGAEFLILLHQPPLQPDIAHEEFEREI